MDPILKNLKRIAIGLGLFFGLILFLFIINQFMLFFDLIYKINPYLAFALTGIFLVLVLYIIIKTAMIWFRAPKAAVLSENPSPEEYSLYLENVTNILSKNSNLADIDFESKEHTKEELVTIAFEKLDELSFPLIKENASTIFLSTAISQNGSLDSILVLVSLTKMTWQLARIYQTRPSLNSILKLYLQVAGIIFMARTLEDSDIIEDQLEPLIASVLGESLASAIPGMVPIANLVVSSIMEGAINAYLTLRVGIIAQSYLGMEVPQSKSLIRRTASIQAVGYMGSIIKDNSSHVLRTIGSSIKKAGSKGLKGLFKFGE